MRKYAIQLKVNNLKDFTTGKSNTNFYLASYCQNGSSEISQCKNILYDSIPFEIEVETELNKLEVWNYDNAKKVGTVFFKNESKQYNFECLFKNQNLKLSLRTPSECEERDAFVNSQKIHSRSNSTEYNSSSEDEN